MEFVDFIGRTVLRSVCCAALLAGCSREPVARVEWTTMGTVAAVQARGAEADAALARMRPAVQRAFADIERLLNAHDRGSELSRLAALPDDRVLARCDASVSNCYATAFRLMRASGGAFNPRWHGTNTLDLGAIAKGFAVDVAAARIADGGDALVDLGGNLKAVRGAWRVGVAGSDDTLVLAPGMACATSAEYFRGKHIRDGRTGAVVSNGVRSVTVVHPSSAMLADGLSTTLFVLGRRDGEAFLKRHFPEARAIWAMAEERDGP